MGSKNIKDSNHLTQVDIDDFLKDQHNAAIVTIKKQL